MPLYTFIADYNGGTYVSQVTAKDPPAALLEWAQQLEVSAIPGIGPKTKVKILEGVRQDAEEGTACVALSGIRNAWCASSLVRDKLRLINLVQTEAHAAHETIAPTAPPRFKRGAFAIK